MMFRVHYEGTGEVLASFGGLVLTARNSTSLCFNVVQHGGLRSVSMGMPTCFENQKTCSVFGEDISEDEWRGGSFASMLVLGPLNSWSEGDWRRRNRCRSGAMNAIRAHSHIAYT